MQVSQLNLSNRLRQKLQEAMPSGAGVLFFMQMISMIAYSVFYSTLVLYATSTLHLNDATANNVTAVFIAFNYILHLLGGYLGGRYFTYRSLFSIGMIAIMTGCLLVAIPSHSVFYWGLAIFLTGCGLNVTCINCMVTQLFEPNDKRREAAFLWNYSGMNIGFFLGFSISGYYQLTSNYTLLFGLSSLSGLIALLITLSKWRQLPDIYSAFSQLTPVKKRLANMKGVLFIGALLLALHWILQHPSLSNSVIILVAVGMTALICLLTFSQPTLTERKKMGAFLILGLASMVFWTLYQMAPMGLTLFSERNIDRHFLGFLITPQWIQNINTVVIILGGPLLSIVFANLRERGVHITLPTLFTFSLLLVGAGFIVLPIGIYFADAQGFSDFNWILLSYILQSLGELFISPIGYAMIGQLAPRQLQGLLMGTWMMISGVASALSGYFSNLAIGATQSTDPLITNASYSHTFAMLGIAAVVTGIVLFIGKPWVLRLTMEVRKS